MKELGPFRHFVLIFYLCIASATLFSVLLGDETDEIRSQLIGISIGGAGIGMIQMVRHYPEILKFRDEDGNVQQ